MSGEINHLDIYDKGLAVINSCTKLEHFITAAKFLALASKYT